jgi:tetratricopeptide (TPR) repeat protein
MSSDQGPVSKPPTTTSSLRRVTLQSQAVGEWANLTILQPDLERARSEHALRHFDAVPKILERVISEAEACVQSPSTSEDARSSYELLLASAHCLLGRTLYGSGAELDSAPHFNRSLELFRKRESQIPQQRNASRLWADYGITLHHVGRLNDAIRALNHTVESGAAPPEAFHYLGRAYRDLGLAEGDRNKLEQAKGALDKGLAMAPGDPGIYVTLAGVLADLGDRAGAVAKYVDAALGVAGSQEFRLASELLEQALKLSPTDPAAVTLAAEVKRAEGDFPAALAILDSALKLQPDAAWALGTKGKLLRNWGKLDAAIHLLRSIPVEDAENAWISSELAGALLDAGLTGEASQELDKALRLSPNDAAALLLKGRSLIAQNRDAEAIPLLERALQSQPDFVDARFELGRAQFKCGQYAESVKTFDQVLATDPAWVEAGEAKANALYASGDWEGALAQSRRALELNPGNPVMLDLAYWSLRQLGRDEDALREMEFELARNAKSAVAWYLKGTLLLDRNQPEAAAEALSQAESLDPSNADAQIALANALRLLGRYGQAGETCGRALQKQDLSSYAMGWAGVYFGEVGDFRQSCEILSRAVVRYPENGWLWGSLGWSLQYRDNESAAQSVDAYLRAIAADGNQRNIWNEKGLADALYLARRDSEAGGKFLQLMKDWPDLKDRSVAYVHGWANCRLGNYAPAIKLLKEAADISPEYLFARFDCGLALAASGNLPEAVETYAWATSEADGVDKLRRRGLLYVAVFDLVETARRGRLHEKAADLIESMGKHLARAGDTSQAPWLISPWARPAKA